MLGRLPGSDAPLWPLTTEQDTGYAMAEQALSAGVRLVLACGGYGTRPGADRARGSGTPLGVILLGTGNLLARRLGLTLNDAVA